MVCVHGVVCRTNLSGFLTPDLWKETGYTATPYEEFSDVLRDQKKVSY
jgi:small subunit ribosomal protein S2e